MTRIVYVLPAAIGLAVCLPAPAASQQAGSAPVPRTLVGVWRAPVDRVPLSDESAWGARTTAVRTTEVRIAADGNGAITVTRSVVNQAGQTLPGSRIIETAEFSVGAIEEPLGLRPRYATTITRGERRYPDPPVVQVPIDDLAIYLYPLDGQAGGLEVRFETFRGEGTFSSRLRRAPGT